jgi:hypothetical protein
VGFFWAIDARHPAQPWRYPGGTETSVLLPNLMAKTPFLVGVFVSLFAWVFFFFLLGGGWFSLSFVLLSNQVNLFSLYLILFLLSYFFFNSCWFSKETESKKNEGLSE